MPTETFTKANGSMTKLMDMERTSTPMGLSTSENGTKTNSMEPVLKNGQMVQSMKDNMLMERNMAMDALPLLMEALTLDNLDRMKFLAQANTFGQMENATKENGKRTKCMAEALLLGETANDMKASL